MTKKRMGRKMTSKMMMRPPKIWMMERMVTKERETAEKVADCIQVVI